MTACNCDPDPARRIGPCETHEAAEYAAWLAETAPRLAAAEAAGDPFIDRDEWPADATEIPEFAPLRAALSDSARDYFDTEWQTQAEMAEWPRPWEEALAVRDSWQALAPAIERDAARMRLAVHCGGEQFPRYPLAEDFEEFLIRESTPEDLRTEADALAALARDALRLEWMLRDHAVGLTKPATYYERRPP